MYTQLKNWFDSNLPIIFYVVLFGFMRSVDGIVPFWLQCAGFGLALMLRFEFMNIWFTRVVKFLELGTLGTILYLTTTMIVRL
jgi:hypothetical protein